MIHHLRILFWSAILAIGTSGPVPARADEGQVQAPAQSLRVKDLIDQLSAPSHTQRKLAFLELCNPALDIEGWAKGQGLSDDLPNDDLNGKDLQLASMVIWLKRLRSLPGSMDAKLDAASDFPALAQGSTEVVERYAKEGKLDLLLEMVRMIPRGGRDTILQTTFTRGENSLDHVFEKAWEIGRPDLIPKFLDAMLPMHPVRIGLNRRWSMLGLGEPWKLQLKLDTSDMQIAALESEDQIAQAVQLAKQTTQPGLLEKILLRNHRWDDWLALDPGRLTLTSAAWSELPRVLILEALDRHAEAQELYQVRKSTGAKGAEQRMLQAQMALVTGDIDAVFSMLKETNPTQLVGMYFLHNRIDDLLDFEGLKVGSQESISEWLDRNIAEGKGLSKATRFQALFRRLGESDWSDKIQERIIAFIESQAPDQQIRFWKDYLQQSMRYGMDEKRAELLAIALRKMEPETDSKRRTGTSIAGFPEAQAEREMTTEDLFRESFPYMKEASFPLYRAIKQARAGQSDRQALEWLQLLHQGVIPSGWTRAEVRKLFQEAAAQRIAEGASPTGSLIDLSEALDAMGALEDAIEMLKSVDGVMQADLMRSRYLWDSGKYQSARSLALESLALSSQSLEAFQWTSDLLEQMHDEPTLKLVDRRVLARPSGMEDFATYSQGMRRSERFELAEPIGRFLEIQYESFPSSLGNLWLEDIYWGWNLSLLANHYHQTAPDYPERVDRNFDLTLTSCLFDIFTEFDAILGGTNRLLSRDFSMGMELDWSQWAWRYERVLAGGFWKAVRQGDRDRADRYLRAAHRLNPEQINTLIDAVPWVLEKFGRQTLREWFLVYYEPMQEHLRKYPKDTMIANNCAWIAVKCGFEIERALELSTMVTERQPTDTYLDTLAEVQFAQGNIDKAMEISLECQRLNPRDPHHRRQMKRYNEGKNGIR